MKHILRLALLCSLCPTVASAQITHRKVCTQAAPASTTTIGCPDWDDTHVVTGGAADSVLVRDPTTADGWKWTATPQITPVTTSWVPVAVSPRNTYVGGLQGYASDGTYHYIVGTNLVEKRNNDATWSLVTNLTNPVSLAPGTDHLGDVGVSGSLLYIPVTGNGNGACGTQTAQGILILNSSNLSLSSLVDISAQGGNPAAIAIATDIGANGTIFVANFCSSTVINKYDLSTKAFLGALTLQTPISSIQGTVYKSGVLYVGDQLGNNGARGNFVYTVNPTTGVVTGPIISKTGAGAWGEPEGLGFYGNNIGWIIANSADARVLFFAPTGTTFPAVTVTATAQVGLGTTTPAYPFDLPAGQARAFRLNTADLFNDDPAAPFLLRQRRAAPSAPVATLVVSAGNCTAGAHSFKITFTTAYGETTASDASNAVTCDAGDARVSLTLDQGGPGVTGRNVYATKAGVDPTVAGNYFLVSTAPVVSDNTAGASTINVADGSFTTTIPLTQSTADDAIFSVTSSGLTVGTTGADGTKPAFKVQSANGTPMLLLANVATGGASWYVWSSGTSNASGAGKFVINNTNSTGSGKFVIDSNGDLYEGGGNGQQFGFARTLTELTTIANAATTDTTIQMPANAVILGVAVRVTTVIPTATSFSVGDSGSAARFSTANVSTAATSTDPGTKAAAYYNAGALSVRLTMIGGTPADTTGRVRVVIYYYTITPPTS